MFTGIILETGEVVSFGRKTAGAVLSVATKGLWKDAAIGDSISINGACLTVAESRGNVLSFDLSEETLQATNLGQLKPGERVNLEPSLRADGKLGGHFVTGHVDGVGRIRSKTALGDTYTIVIEAPEKLTGLLVEKGSIAVDGISLTVVEVWKDAFSVVIIPHTAALTTIGFKGPGSAVNLEVDIIGKYVAKFVNKGTAVRSGSDEGLMKSLIKAGYIQEE